MQRQQQLDKEQREHRYFSAYQEEMLLLLPLLRMVRMRMSLLLRISLEEWLNKG